jgi:DNA-binding FrmR family transcriptional regulator
MVEFEKPYFVIIHQTRAIRFALKKVDQILLREYLVYCVDDENSRDELKQKIHQTVAMFNKLDG